MKKLIGVSSYVKKKLDKLWREAIYARANYRCERCGKTMYLNPHHCISRRFIAIRWDIDNGICLCSGCHLLAHHNSIEFGLWIISKRGRAWFEKLSYKKDHKRRFDFKLLESELKVDTKVQGKLNLMSNAFAKEIKKRKVGKVGRTKTQGGIRDKVR